MQHVILVQVFFPPDWLAALTRQMRIIFPAEKSSTLRHAPRWCSACIFNHIPAIFINMWGIWFFGKAPLEAALHTFKNIYLFIPGTTSFFEAEIKTFHSKRAAAELCIKRKRNLNQPLNSSHHHQQRPV